MSESDDIEDMGKELRWLAGEFLKSVKTFINVCIWTKNIKALRDLISLFDRFTASEVINTIKAAGLEDEIAKLAERAGHLPKER